MKQTRPDPRLLLTSGSFLNRASLLILLPLLLLTFSAYADTTGIIGGIVSDTDGDPLIGATVMIDDTFLGAMTDGNGEYIISGVSPGS